MSEQGTIKSIKQGYGFIHAEGGDDVFFHFGDVNEDDKQRLHERATVQFTIVQGEKGPKAMGVSVVHDAPSPQRAPVRGPNKRQHGGNPSRRTYRRVSDLWPGYLTDGYFDSQGHLLPELLSRDHVHPLAEAMAHADPPLSTHQIRRYFQHARRCERALKLGDNPWERIRPQVQRLAISAQDAYGKDKQKIPALFCDFITMNIGTIRSADDFLRGFLPHFEALVGYGSGQFTSKG